MRGIVALFCLVLCATAQAQGNVGATSHTGLESGEQGDETTRAKVPTKMFAPLILDGAPLGTVQVVLDPDTDRPLWFDGAKLLKALAGALEPPTLSRVQQAVDAENQVNAADLAELGIEVIFDVRDVELTLRVPPQARLRSAHNLGFRQQALPESAGTALRPAGFNAGMDVFLAQNWRNQERQSLNMELDTHLNLHGWVLQDRHSLDTGAERNWQRRETQLIHDWPEHRTRLSVGDLSYRGIGLMGSPVLSGVSLGTRNDLQPYSVTYPLSRQRFDLEYDSRVDVYVNGARQASLQLAAGPHDILDLPLIDGVNRVVLEIIDPFGRRQILEFDSTQEQRLLAPGLDEYSLTVGVPRRFTGGKGLEYEGDRKSLSGFYRRGLSEDFTAGAHLEFDEDVAMSGLSGVFSATAGTVAYDVAASRDNAVAGLHPALSLDYRYRTFGWSVTAGYQWQAPDFATLSQRAASDNTRHAGRLSFTLPRIYGWSSTVSVSASKRWGGRSRNSQRLSLTRRLGNDWRLSLETTRQSEGSKDDLGVGLRLYWSPRGSRLQGSASYATQQQEQIVEASYLRQGELGLDASTFLQRSDQQQIRRVDAGYVHPRLESRFAATRGRQVNGPRLDTQRLTLNTALVYVDGSFAISRPLNGQPFVLLRGRRGLGDTQIGVIRGNGLLPATTLDGAGAATVLPNLSPYYVNEINLDLSELPMDVQMEKQQFRVLSAYRSATLLEVGVEGSAYLLGRLVDPAGQPLRYEVGRLLAAAGMDTAPALLFTDEDGHFEVSGAKPGSYRVEMDTAQAHRGELEVPEGSVGRLQLGNVMLLPAGR